MQNFLPMEHPELDTSRLNAVHAQFQRGEPFSLELFEGFESLRVLTYSASILMTVKMLNRFETVECVFGYEGVLQKFSTVLACQKVLSENFLIGSTGTVGNSAIPPPLRDVTGYDNVLSSCPRSGFD